MKKGVIIGVILVIIAFVAGYFVGDSTAVNRINKLLEQNVSRESEEPDLEQKEPKQDKTIPIHPDKIRTSIEILEPNSIGTVYMEATYINDSEYPIISYSAKVLLKDKNETVYLTNHDVVLPGETSPKFDTFGPDTGKDEDYQILSLDLRARTENGKTLAIEYDFKLDEASWMEYDN